MRKHKPIFSRLTSPTIILVGISIVAVILSRILYAPCDDAYIFLVYAKNLLGGNGLTFNGTVVEGFSSPVWMASLVLFGLLRIPLPALMQILSTLSGIFAIYATYLLSIKILKDPKWALLPTVLLVGSGDFVFYMGVGLEQILFVGLVALSVAEIWEDFESALKKYTLPGYLAILILTRPEGVLFSALILIWGWIRVKSLWPSFKTGLRLTAFLAPIMVAKRLYFGFWLPNTYYVKSNSGLANLDHGKVYLIRNGLRYWPVVVLVILVTIILVIRKKPKTILVISPLLIMSAMWGVYVWLVGGDNLVGGRMLVPVLPLIYAGTSKLVKESLGLFPWSLAIMILISVTTFIGYTQDELTSAHAQRWRNTFPNRMAAGLHLKNNFPPNTLVALNPAGIIPYYSELPTIDMLGLNDVHIAHFGKRDYSLDFGHQAGDGLYVLSKEPDVILFGGGVSVTPAQFISDREIANSPGFDSLYQKQVWPGIGTAYLRIPME